MGGDKTQSPIELITSKKRPKSRSKSKDLNITYLSGGYSDKPTNSVAQLPYMLNSNVSRNSKGSFISQNTPKSKVKKKLKNVTSSISRIGRKSMLQPFSQAPDFVTPKPTHEKNKMKFKLISASAMMKLASASALNKIPQRNSVINASPASVQNSMSLSRSRADFSV